MFFSSEAYKCTLLSEIILLKYNENFVIDTIHMNDIRKLCYIVKFFDDLGYFTDDNHYFMNYISNGFYGGSRKRRRQS